MFVDRVSFEVASGKGGAGCTSFRREKFVVKGGPDGGDGGKGGDVIFEVDNNTDTLSWYKGRTKIKAENGKPGLGSKCTGKSAPALILKVPPGTQIIDEKSDEVLIDFVHEGEKAKLLQGGKGGLGNTHFKSSRNQRPTHSQPGQKGETRKIRLELKLIADIGLVGYPNVGKSTLISATSNAKPQIANYEFTTLTPKLGIVEVGEYDSFVMADIPGIIDGASQGRGLGLEFLRHIERTEVLLYLIDLANHRSMKEQFTNLQNEVKNFSSQLAKRKFAIAISKIDTSTDENSQQLIQEFLNDLSLERSDKNDFGLEDTLPYFIQDTVMNECNTSKPFCVVPISSVTKRNIEPLKYALKSLKDIK